MNNNHPETKISSVQYACIGLSGLFQIEFFLVNFSFKLSNVTFYHSKRLNWFIKWTTTIQKQQISSVQYACIGLSGLFQIEFFLVNFGFKLSNVTFYHSKRLNWFIKWTTTILETKISSVQYACIGLSVLFQIEFFLVNFGFKLSNVTFYHSKRLNWFIKWTTTIQKQKLLQSSMPA